ncbi:sensor histidine kinase [Clostridium weizhouense]|uniref:histidine kinase n=1 Tax=Clostridium weizhouense TaxID=2859781 RepID=A0ABS7ATQ6_9CLOT|nr:HAMP domain-containing sensor histidine kinase [Clostridium weizhouense]MBW6411851.1 HAMP domain-containing histidine kinase [Clostridium weizhouense]
MNRSKENSLIKRFSNNEKLEFISIEGLIMFIIYNLYFLFTKKYKLYNTINICINIAVNMGIAYICLVKISVLKNHIVEYLGVENIFICLFTILNLFLPRYIFEQVSVGYYTFFTNILYCFEFTILSLGFYFINKRINIKKAVIVYIFVGAMILILFNNIYVFNNIYIFNSNEDLNSVIIFNLLTVSLVTFFMIFSLLNYGKILSDFLLKIMYVYVFFRFFGHISTLALVKGYNEFLVISACLNLSGIYLLYRGFVSWFISDSVKSMRKNLELANKVNIELLTAIKKRNRILNDTNIMIEKSHSRYNKLIDSVYDGVFLFSEDKLEYINRTGLGLLNYINKEEILGIELDIFIENHFDFDLKEFNDREIHITDAKMKCNNLVVDLFIVYVDENSKLIYIHDVTELNKTKIMRNKLEKYLREEELKNQFFSNVSHELRTPINLIYSAIQLNEIYLKQENIDSIKKNNKIIKQNSLRLIRTINNFIDTNRISEGYLKPDFKNYNIVEVVENISIACNKYINKAGINLIFDSEFEEIYVKCDKDMIERIILNIISNSVKYGKKGGEIQVYISVKYSNVIINVQNNGYRIEEDTIPYVFDKFTKINKSLNRLKEGSGLGLFLSKALIELQGGKIDLTSGEEGNLFTINFPITKQEYDTELQYCIEMNNIEEKVDVEFSDIYME